MITTLNTCPFSFSILSPQMSSLCRRLDELWEENQGCVILFTWIQFLKEEALEFLGIQPPLEVIRGGSKTGGERRKPDPADTGTICTLLKRVVFAFVLFFFSLYGFINIK